MNEVAPITNPSVWKLLGGLRFVLAGIVVCGHLFRFVRHDDAPTNLLFLFGSLGAVAAVICFLLISGFSIAHSISVNPAGYLRRRALRIYPLYLLGIALALVPYWHHAGPIVTLNGSFAAPAATTIIGNLFFLQGFLVPAIDSNRPLWTLAVEVACYVLAPMLIRAPRAILVFMTISILAYAIFPKLHLEFYGRLLYGLPLLFLGWAWLAGFIFYIHRGNSGYRFGIICLGILLFCINRSDFTRFSMLTYVISATILVFCEDFRLPPKLLNWCNYAGEISYPLYVFHYPVLIFACSVFGIANGLVLVMLTLVVAITFYHLVDSPLRRGRLY